MRKLFRRWHGPFRIKSREDPDVTVANVYFPGDAPIRVHQNRVAHCPREFPAGYFWYGGKRKGRGKPPKWVEKLLQAPSSEEGLEPQGEDIESDSEATKLMCHRLNQTMVTHW